MKTTIAFIAAAAIVVTATALITRHKSPTPFQSRFDAVMDASPSEIPYAKLHDRALEILRSNTLAREEVTADDKAHADVEACIAFKKTPMEYTTCK